jgi:hypothetical protein
MVAKRRLLGARSILERGMREPLGALEVYILTVMIVKRSYTPVKTHGFAYLKWSSIKQIKIFF